MYLEEIVKILSLRHQDQQTAEICDTGTWHISVLFTFHLVCLWSVWRLTIVDFGADNALPAAHMPTIRWLSASIAWMRASNEPVRGWTGLDMQLLRLHVHINKTSFLHSLYAYWQRSVENHRLNYNFILINSQVAVLHAVHITDLVMLWRQETLIHFLTQILETTHRFKIWFKILQITESLHCQLLHTLKLLILTHLQQRDL